MIDRDKEPLTLAEALRVLSDVHTRDDEVGTFVVMIGATPDRYYPRSERYIEAWALLRQHMTDPDIPDPELP